MPRSTEMRQTGLKFSGHGTLATLKEVNDTGRTPASRIQSSNPDNWGYCNIRRLATQGLRACLNCWRVRSARAGTSVGPRRGFRWALWCAASRNSPPTSAKQTLEDRTSCHNRRKSSIERSRSSNHPRGRCGICSRSRRTRRGRGGPQQGRGRARARGRYGEDDGAKSLSCTGVSSGNEKKPIAQVYQWILLPGFWYGVLNRSGGVGRRTRGEFRFESSDPNWVSRAHGC